MAYLYNTEAENAGGAGSGEGGGAATKKALALALAVPLAPWALSQIAGLGGLGTLGSGEAATEGGAAAAGGGVLPSSVIGTGAIGPIAGGASGLVPAAIGTGAAAGTTAAATGGGMGFWGSLGKILTGGVAGAIGDVVSAGINAHSQSEAAKAQADAAQKALDFYKGAYERKLTDLNPYRNLGVSATSALANGLGLPNPSPVAPPGSPLVTGQPPQNIPIANPGPPGSAPPIGSTVKMRSPNGTVRDVPISEVGRLMQVGGVRVD